MSRMPCLPAHQTHLPSPAQWPWPVSQAKPPSSDERGIWVCAEQGRHLCSQGTISITGLPVPPPACLHPLYSGSPTFPLPPLVPEDDASVSSLARVLTCASSLCGLRSWFVLGASQVYRPLEVHFKKTDFPAPAVEVLR